MNVMYKKLNAPIKEINIIYPNSKTDRPFFLFVLVLIGGHNGFEVDVLCVLIESGFVTGV